jgi:hypothetical protein
MTKRIHVKKDKNVDVVYETWLGVMSALIAAKNQILIIGRGGGKTTNYMAERSMMINKAMPSAYFFFLSDTYVNALDNIVPSLLEGWERKGYKEGVDFVTDAPPPNHFLRPYKQPLSYKHTMSTRYGNFYKLGSADVPASLAGNSYQHGFIDETRNISDYPIRKIMPALRGFPVISNSVFYRGITATTDMPNIAEGDFDWVLGHDKNMNVEQIKHCLQIGIKLNKIRLQIYNAVRDKDMNALKRLEKQLYRWTIRHLRARKNSTLFYQASALTNVGILSPGYFQDQLDLLGPEEFKSAVLTFKPTIKKGEKFYSTLGNHHFYDDGLLPNYYKDKYKIGESIGIGSSQALKYINHKQEIDVGVDFGNMCSMICGQEQGNYVYLLKELFTLAPEHTKELAFKFITFFKDHGKKVLNMYYDRSGNQNAAIKKDYATELAKFIRDKGWTVNLMNKNQATIFQEEEFNLMKHFFAGTNAKLPNILVDKFQCSNYKSSIELAKTKISKNRRTGSSMIQKDKSSEKLPIAQLPKYSTNFSDAGKYFFFRPEWVKYVQSKGILTLGAPSIG